MSRLVASALAAGIALGALSPAAAGGASGAPTVTIVDNAFVRVVQRPEVRIRAGHTVRWHWRAQQSHGVAVRSGPERFASAIKTRGGYAHRFTRRGRYALVCPLHAPGMRMTVVVR